MTGRVWVHCNDLNQFKVLPGGYLWDGRKPLEKYDTSHCETSSYWHSPPEFRSEIGDQFLLLVAYGRPKRFVLWSVSQIIERFQHESGELCAVCSGHVLNPPVRLQGKSFLRFKAYFGKLGLEPRIATNHPYTKILLKLAEDHRQPVADRTGEGRSVKAATATVHSAKKPVVSGIRKLPAAKRRLKQGG